MKLINKILLMCLITFTYATANNSYLENYFRTINKNIVDFIYIGNVFREILHDNSQEVKPNIYGHIYKKNTPPSVNQAREALEFLKINEYAGKSYGAPWGWSRVENISGDEGFNAAVFRKNSTIVIAYRGAEAGTSDWITDGVSQSGEIAKQYDNALDLADKYLSDFPNANIILTGYSLGGALASYAGLSKNLKVYNFNPLSLNQKSIDFIKEMLLSDGYNQTEFTKRTHNIINYAFPKEFVTDADNQQDGDSLFKFNVIGDIYYVDDKRFNPLLLDNGIFRHLLAPLKEELTFLSKPYFRNNRDNLNAKNNSVHPIRSLWYIDYTLDDFDILYNTSTYLIHSLPSFLNDIKGYLRH